MRIDPLTDPGGLLRRAPLDAGRTQRELAARVGVHHSMISVYETGAKAPKVETLQRLLGAAGVTLTAHAQRAGAPYVADDP